MKLIRVLTLFLLLFTPPLLRAEELTVFAAASLADALKEIAPVYQAKSGDTLRFNFGASSTLARQIKEGAPADLFFSADEAKMNDLATGDFVLSETRRSVLSNTLVIVVAAEGGPALSGPADLAGEKVKRLALAETQTVPAGIYARDYLTKLGLWPTLAPKIIAVENVRAALAVVESGNVEAGIVYRTDALVSNKVRIAYAVPAAEGPRISYPLAVVRDSKHSEAAKRLAAFLEGPEAQAIFFRRGFLPPL